MPYITGHRCQPHADGKCRLGYGDFGKQRNDVWWVRLPESGQLISLLDLATPVTEHSDGTISVGGPLRSIVRNSEGENVEAMWKLDHGRWSKTEKVLQKA